MGSGKGFEGPGFAAIGLLIVALSMLAPKPKPEGSKLKWAFGWVARLGVYSLAGYGLWRWLA